MKCDWDIKVEQTGWGCHSVWEGTATDPSGTEWEIYVRFRWGVFRVLLDDQIIYERPISDGLDGIIDWDKAKKHVWMALNWLSMKKVTESCQNH